ncbi:MAG: TlyA family RNA methyltransferase, partial [Endomicrobia bacterium]|nr:TlyA family RNA methyltransferase [Endomicrobiia bacterium]
MKQRLDKILVDKKIIESRSKARQIIDSYGVSVNGKVVNDPSLRVEEITDIKILQEFKYVSAGGYKLEGILKTNIVDVKDKICFDVGSSTGGFVDCLLKFGASKVYCCDVGRALLHEKLRKDSRVILFEGINFRYFVELGCTKEIKDKIDIFTVDVSFISLTKILPVIRNVARYDHTVIALIKPQFESEPRYIKKGIVKEEQYRIQAVEKISNFAETQLNYKKIFIQES